MQKIIKNEIKQVLELIPEFKNILLAQKQEELGIWLEKAENYKFSEVDCFIKLIKSDLEAVQNAITYKYSLII